MSMFRDLINQPFGSLKLESEDETELKVDDDKVDGEDDKPEAEVPADIEGYFSKVDDDSTEEKEEEMKILLTPVLLGETLTEGEIEEFRESMDSELAIQDGYVTERTIVRMDKAAKKSQLQKVATIAIAREKKDPLYKKLALVWKMERRLETLIAKKYKSQAQQRVTKYLQDAKKSKVSAIKNAASKLVGKKK